MVGGHIQASRIVVGGVARVLCLLLVDCLKEGGARHVRKGLRLELLAVQPVPGEICRKVRENKFFNCLLVAARDGDDVALGERQPIAVRLRLLEHAPAAECANQ